MNRVAIRLVVFSVLIGWSAPLQAALDESLDAFSSRLVFNSPGGGGSLRLSGTFDLEGYGLSQPSDDSIFTESRWLFSPRLSVFADAQWGRRLYVFSQVRLDRGYDPSDGGWELRFDEYAVRWSASEMATVQAGRFGTVVGSWVKRHLSWDNAFVTPPLAYSRLTGIWDTAPARSPTVLLRWGHVIPDPELPYENADKHLRQPIIWGASYTTGAAVFLRAGFVELAAEVKNASLSSRPEAWDLDEVGWEHPALSARLGVRPDERWNLGLSVSSGTYLLPGAWPSLRPGHGLNDYRQWVVGHDASFAWRHLQVWGEVFWSRFENPLVGNADVLSWYLETKYKFTPFVSGALRVNSQTYTRVESTPPRRWGRNTQSADFALTYRFAAHLQSKLQYTIERQSDAQAQWAHVAALQTTLRF